MNFLAHIYLSGADPMIKIGNFMADGIKGKQYLAYPTALQKGILLHRFIDSYTDAHPIFKQSTKRLHATYHHYSGIIVDMYYDHFLSKNWHNYCATPLIEFVNNFYKSLEQNYEVLDNKTKYLMPYMLKNNWLYNYQYLGHLEQILIQMDNRINNKSNMGLAITNLKNNYSEFEQEFTAFFEQIDTEVKKWFLEH